ncbi:MAG: Na/Pi cotransporter family protein [Clostridia bacterium]|nr:Na/Pi cotransporter family protein [Clostridia bacterium]
MSAVEIFLVIVTMIGGLALFMFGMNVMSKALSSLTGGVLDKLLGLVTKNRFTAFLFGTTLTAVVQSSSAVSVLTVGLVSSGIIMLHQAIGLLIGGGLGSTATAWLLSLNALDGESLIMTIIKPSSFSPFLAIAGVAITMFAKKEKTLNIGNSLLGFAVMMIGMNLMSQGVAPLKELPALKSALVSFSNPIIGFLVACAITMLIQSSDATVGIVQAFALSMGLSFGAAIPLICGAQVGTCVTAVISSLGASNNGKRTALMNLYYALLKVIPFMLLFYGVNAFLHFPFLEGAVGGIGIPLCHTAINLFGAALWIPGGGLIVSLAQKTIPFSEEEKQARENVLTMLDENLLRHPSIALDQTDRAVSALAGTVGEAMQSLLQFNSENDKTTRILLERIRQYRDQIDSYITKLSAHTSDTKDAAFILLLTNANTAFGEIGVICESIVNFNSKLSEMSSSDLIRDTDRTEMQVLGNSIAEILDLTVIGYETKDVLLSGTIQLYREEVMQMGDILKARHYKRMHGEGGRLTSTTLYADICYTEERLIDYCDIVADSLIKYNLAFGGDKSPAAERTLKAKQHVHELFMDKYEMLNIGEDGSGRMIDLSE